MSERDTRFYESLAYWIFTIGLALVLLAVKGL